MTILSFLLILGPLIFVHELGHYFVGRWFGVKAEIFSIGFGREIIGWNGRHGTYWKIGWLPLGGYVKFAGDAGPASTPSREWLMLSPEERAQTFQGKSVWKRFLIVAAGPFTNFFFAILIFFGFFHAFGEQRTPPIVAAVTQASAAEQAGIRPGDQIVRVADEEIDRFEDIARVVSFRPGARMEIELLRDGERVEVSATPTTIVERDQFGNEFRRGLLGIAPSEPIVAPLSAGAALVASISQTWTVVEMSVEGIGQMIMGSRSVRELGGPLKIAKFSGEQASMGWESLLSFMAIISINLGFINLLPIPLLDGGHLLFYLIEAVKGRPVRQEAQEWAFKTGLAALLALMIFVTLNDLASFGLWTKLGGLIG